MIRAYGPHPDGAHLVRLSAREASLGENVALRATVFELAMILQIKKGDLTDPLLVMEAIPSMFDIFD